MQTLFGDQLVRGGLFFSHFKGELQPAPGGGL